MSPSPSSADVQARPSASAIALLAHGSRDPAWRGFVDAVIDRARRIDPLTTVVAAYVEHTRPDLIEAVDALVEQGFTHVVVLPLFFGLGRHVRDDVPALVAQVRARHPALRVVLCPSAGEEPAVLEALARLALDRVRPK